VLHEVLVANLAWVMEDLFRPYQAAFPRNVQELVVVYDSKLA
jgi:hypothetical protein